MDRRRDNFPSRTLFLNKGVFYPYTVLDNGKFPWEDISATARIVRELLDKSGFTCSVHETIRVRFSRDVADMIGGKKRAKDFLSESFRVMSETYPQGPDFFDIELHAPQK